MKADGWLPARGWLSLALGGGREALAECFVTRRFGDAANIVLIEELLEGEEVSLLSIVSGSQILPLAPAQDYKRLSR